MSYRFGSRALLPMLLVGASVFLTFRIGIEDWDDLYIYVDQNLQAALIAVFTAFAFYPSASSQRISIPVEKHWRWSLATAFFLLGMGQVARNLAYVTATTSAVQWDYWSPLAVIVASTALRHADLIANVQRSFPVFRAATYVLVWVLLIFAAAALPVEVQLWLDDDEEWSASLRPDNLWGCLYALSFVVVASRSLSLRQALLLTVTTCISGLASVWVLGHWWPMTHAEYMIPATSMIKDTNRLLLGTAFDCASIALLGAATARYWSSLDWSDVTARWMPALCVAIVLLQFVGNPLVMYRADVLILGGLAFAATLTWGIRAVFSVPFALQLCYLLSSAAFATDTNGIFTECVRIGMIAFPFAFFGLLARRSVAGPAP